jgi:hypothetical protein
MDVPMGTFFHPITIVGPAGEETVEALVDTDAMFAEIPADILGRLGVIPSQRGYRGDRQRGIAQARARLGGHGGWVMCVFVEPGAQPKIGRHTLDGFVLDIDERGELVPKTLHEIRHF